MVRFTCGFRPAHEEILRKFVDLSKSDMTDEEKEELMELILDHRDAFSLRDEIGECPT